MIRSSTPCRRGAADGRVARTAALLLIAAALLLSSIPLIAQARVVPRVRYGKIAGRIVDSGGSPLRGISVSVYKRDTAGVGGYTLLRDVRASTNASGTYLTGNIPAGRYRVMFTDEASGTHAFQCWPDSPVLQTAADVVVPASATTSGVDATLQAGATIEGTVTDSVGAPIAEIGQTLWRFNPATLGYDMARWTGDGSGADGSYEFTGLPAGAWKVQFTDWRGAWASVFFGGSTVPSEAADVMLTAGGVVDHIDATMRRVTKVQLFLPRSPLSYLATVTPAAKLSTASASLPGRTDVQVYSAIASASVWSLEGTASFDATSGLYKGAPRKVAWNTQFKFVFPGDSAYAPSEASGGVQVRVSFSVPAVRPAVPRPMQPFVLTGTMQPVGAGSVTLKVYRSSGRQGYRLWRACPTTLTLLADVTAYRATLKLPAGTYVLSATHTDRYHAASSSRTVGFTVKP